MADCYVIMLAQLAPGNAESVKVAQATAGYLTGLAAALPH